MQEPITKEKLDAIEQSLVQILTEQYEKGTISYEELKRASKYILERVVKIVQYEDLSSFLQNLAARWTIFQPLATLESAQAGEGQDAQKISELTSYIKSFIPKP
jgi:hypothetical protein